MKDYQIQNECSLRFCCWVGKIGTQRLHHFQWVVLDLRARCCDSAFHWIGHNQPLQLTPIKEHPHDRALSSNRFLTTPFDLSDRIPHTTILAPFGCLPVVRIKASHTDVLAEHCHFQYCVSRYSLTTIACMASGEQIPHPSHHHQKAARVYKCFRTVPKA